MDILAFCEKDKQEQSKNSGNPSKKSNNFLSLSKEVYRGCTYIYKPLLDINGLPYRRVKNPIELHIQCPDENGNLRWRTYSILGNMNDYGRLTDREQILYKNAKELLCEVGQWSEEQGYPYLSERKLKIVFYAYTIAMLDANNNPKDINKGFTIVDHTSVKFTESFHKIRETKSSVMGTGTWINDYFDIEKPGHNVVVKTTNATQGFGMDVTVDFMERGNPPTVDELKAAQEFCGDLNNLVVKASFNPEYFEEIIKVCSEWKKAKLSEKASSPVESNLDKIQTEVANGKVGDIGQAVSPLGQPLNGNPPPPPSSQMQV